eukprot:scaffold35793_cov22-Cyclotella_meneghiniana.AAC.1
MSSFCNPEREQERPSRRKEAVALIVFTAAVILLFTSTSSSSSSLNGNSNNKSSQHSSSSSTMRQLWSQNIFWSGDPTRVPPPPPPKHHYQPKPPKVSSSHPPPPAPRLPAKGNPFENLSDGGGGMNPLSSGGSQNKKQPKPSPSPPVPKPNPPSAGSAAAIAAASAVTGAISSSNYYSRPSNQYSYVKADEEPSTDVEVESAPSVIVQEEEEQGFEFDGTFSIGPPKQQQTAESIVTPSSSFDTIQETAPAVTQEEYSSSITQQHPVVSQTTSITSTIKLSGIPSTIPPYGSMERMALLNLLVHRVESELTSHITTTTTMSVKEITILSIGNVDMTTRRRGLRAVGRKDQVVPKENGNNGNDVIVMDRTLWSSTQPVTFQALIEYTCSDEDDEESCSSAAQSSADDLVNEITSPNENNDASSSTQSINDGVDNTGENWSSIGQPSASQFVWLPDGTLTDYQVITSKPSNEPTSSPSSLPTTSVPTSTPTSSPVQTTTIMQSYYAVNIEIDTTNNVTPNPTSPPTSNKPTSPSAITENEWFATAGLFQGDAAKRYCGYDWADVVDNCL